MFKNILNKLSDRGLYFVTRWKLRYQKSSIDLLEDGLGDGTVILWPISERGKTFMRDNIECKDEAGNIQKIPRKRGGYHVTRGIREQIHHNGCPMIATMAGIGMIIDTP